MRNLFFKSHLVLVFLLLLSMHNYGQYVTLEGRQFKLNGTNFYPLVCDYSMQLIYNGTSPTISDYYLSPQNGYGPGSTLTPLPYWPNYDFDDETKISAYAKLNADFARIKAMGFNAIRTHGLTVKKTNPSPLNPSTFVAPVSVSGFTLKATENKHPIWDSTATNQNLVINSPYVYLPNTYLKLLFDTYDAVFTAAQANDLHVLLDVSGGDLTKTVADVNDYGNYLEALASHFKNNPNLMAYVVIEEPGYQAIHQDNTGHKKQQICDYTSIWYDAIKSSSRGNDQNHLITVGGFEIGDVLEWDPGVMKIDFFSPHVYPKVLDYEGYSYNSAINRVSGYLGWLKKNCPMPWMPGESGFSACEDTYYYNTHPVWTSSWNPSPFLWPYDDGDVNQQLQFATYILPEVRNAGGSGYSWWNYQENWWTVSLDDARQEGYGLIDHLSNDKPVVAAFMGYLGTAGQTVTGGSTFTLPLNYYNPFNLAPSAYSYSGTVFEEGSTNPVGDAFVFGWIDYYTASSNPLNPPILHRDNIYTFSDSNTGMFNLNTLNPNAISYGLNPLIQINKITFSTTSAERESFGVWVGSALPSAVNLKHSPFKYDLTVTNETINNLNSPKNFKGWNSISVSNNVVIQASGISDFRAKNEINIEPEFSSENGSEVHLYCTPIPPDCADDLNGFLKVSIASINSNTPSDGETLKDIELAFSPLSNTSFLLIEPNPNNGIFNLKLIYNRKEKINSQLNVYDMFNNLVFQNIFEPNSITLDLSYLPKAVYCIQLKNKYEIISQKIIIN